MSATIINVEQNILTITINRPDALNAINQDVMKRLHSFFTSTHNDYQDIHGVMITGTGNKAFAAGADIKEFKDISQEETTRLSKFGQETYASIENFHLPVIAVVNGFALGGGCELAMACHMRIATPSAKFGQPEVNLGLIPGYGGTQRLVQLIGKAKAFEYLLTANMIPADEALNLGLVNYVLEHEEAIAFAKKMISKIGKKGPMAVAECIKAVNIGTKDEIAGYDYEADLFGKIMVSNQAKEGVAAFIEKRKPNFN